MTKRGGSTIQSPSSSSAISAKISTRDSMPPSSHRRLESKCFSNEKIYTILLTSFLWIILLLTAVFLTIQYNSSKHCPENNLIKSIKYLVLTY